MTERTEDREKSCGAIVFTHIHGVIYYVIVEQRSGRHCFPKGHVEPGETEHQTALREIWEETKSGVSELLGRYGFTREGDVWRCDRNTRETLCLFCHFGISVAVLACLFSVSPVPLWHHALSLPSSLTEVVTEERVPGEASFRLLRFGDITHLEAAGLRRSTAGLFPECCPGVDSTDPRVNGELPWEL